MFRWFKTKMAPKEHVQDLVLKASTVDCKENMYYVELQGTLPIDLFDLVKPIIGFRASSPHTFHERICDWRELSASSDARIFKFSIEGNHVKVQSKVILSNYEYDNLQKMIVPYLPPDEDDRVRAIDELIDKKIENQLA